MKKVPKIAQPGRKKAAYKPVAGSFGWDLGNLVFDKRIRVNGKEIRECGNVHEIVDKIICK